MGDSKWILGYKDAFILILLLSGPLPTKLPFMNFLPLTFSCFCFKSVKVVDLGKRLSFVNNKDRFHIHSCIALAISATPPGPRISGGAGERARGAGGGAGGTRDFVEGLQLGLAHENGMRPFFLLAVLEG